MLLVVCCSIKLNILQIYAFIDNVKLVTFLFDKVISDRLFLDRIHFIDTNFAFGSVKFRTILSTYQLLQSWLRSPK